MIKMMNKVTHGLGELLKSGHADKLEGSTGVPEPLHVHLASLASSLLCAVLLKSNWLFVIIYSHS
jgi:hypothetical protein